MAQLLELAFAHAAELEPVGHVVHRLEDPGEGVRQGPVEIEDGEPIAHVALSPAQGRAASPSRPLFPGWDGKARAPDQGLGVSITVVRVRDSTSPAGLTVVVVVVWVRVYTS